MGRSLDIVIVTMDSELYIVDCLDSLIDNPPCECSYSIHVIDNCSRDNTPSLVSSMFPEVHLSVNDQSRSLSANNNQGIVAGRADYVLVLNPDTRVSPGTIDLLIDYLEANPNVGICAPKLLNPDQTLQYSCRVFPTPLAILSRGTFLHNIPLFQQIHKTYLLANWDHSELREVDWVLGACMMIRRKLFDEVGLMDENYRLYYEDIDFCYRANQHGWKVMYYPYTTVMHHYHRESALRFNKKTIWHIFSILRYFGKYWIRK